MHEIHMPLTPSWSKIYVCLCVCVREGGESCIYYVTFKKQLAHRRLPKQLDLFCSVLKQKDIGLMKCNYKTIQPANVNSFDFFSTLEKHTQITAWMVHTSHVIKCIVKSQLLLHRNPEMHFCSEIGLLYKMWINMYYSRTRSSKVGNYSRGM